MRLLVTGGAGFIGSNFTRHALTAGHDVVVYDALTYAGDRRSLGDKEGRFTFVHADIGDAGAAVAALDAHGIDAVVNLAAETIVDDRPGHDRRYLLDSSKIAGDLHWTPSVSFTEGLRETVRWYAAHRSWWEPLRDRAPVVEQLAWMR